MPNRLLLYEIKTLPLHRVCTKSFLMKHLFIETYGCQMNVNDSEVILSILQDEGYALTEKGAAFFKNNKKFLESKSRANTRLCALLCAEQINGEVTPYELSDAAYTEACDALRRKYAIPAPDLTIEAEGGDLYLRFGGR